ncbi:MAG: ribonuclease PH [Planctomycetaceae bacterium]|jgi:ribonuclease PH|nr:ribonuclease PH [Planctomycetaceae bacterium]
MRCDKRKNNELRPITVRRHFTEVLPGSVFISAGKTVVLCSACIADELPKWMPKDSTKGWLTAEYRMLPGSTSPRTPRSDRPDGRSTEIQRLIGRSLRAVIDLNKLGPRTVFIDCDVLQADGGTRTLSITGAYIALVDAVRTLQLPKMPITDAVAAVSVGIVNGIPVLDLPYCEDSAAQVDMNLVMTGSGKFVEIQGTGEDAAFSEEELAQLLKLGKQGIKKLLQIQKNALHNGEEKRYAM